MLRLSRIFQPLVLSGLLSVSLPTFSQSHGGVAGGGSVSSTSSVSPVPHDLDTAGTVMRSGTYFSMDIEDDKKHKHVLGAMLGYVHDFAHDSDIVDLRLYRMFALAHLPEDVVLDLELGGGVEYDFTYDHTAPYAEANLSLYREFKSLGHMGMRAMGGLDSAGDFISAFTVSIPFGRKGHSQKHAATHAVFGVSNEAQAIAPLSH